MEIYVLFSGVYSRRGCCCGGNKRRISGIVKKNDKVLCDMMVVCCLNNIKVGVWVIYEEFLGVNVFLGV